MFSYKTVYNNLVIIYLVITYKTIHVYYLNKSNDLLNNSVKQQTNLKQSCYKTLHGNSKTINVYF